MDIVFLGGVFEKDKIPEIMEKSKSAIQFAADALQWSIIEGLDYWNEKPVKIINAPFVGSYPKHYKDFYVKGSKWQHVINANDYNVGFFNLWGIKNIFRAIGISKELKKWTRVDTKEKVVIGYSINFAFLWAMFKAKKKKKTITTCLIVPDLPEYMSLTSEVSIAYKLAKRIENALTKTLMKHVDLFVLLTEPMAQALKIGEKPYCIVEGMVNSRDLNTNVKIGEENQTKSILYTGTLNYKYGIGILLEAFGAINDNSYELWICGYGEAEEQIKEMAEVDLRIKWFGAVSREQALSMQQKATILINPRPPGEDFTKYSFPSKNLEYLLSGRPVIAYKLPGIPDEYDDYYFFINGNTIGDMKEKILEILNLSNEDLYQFGIKTRKFVLENKNNQAQTKIILDMIAAYL